MRLHVRIDQADSHVHMTVWVNHGHAGRICMQRAEAVKFIDTLSAGASVEDVHFEVTGEHDIWSAVSP